MTCVYLCVYGCVGVNVFFPLFLVSVSPCRTTWRAHDAASETGCAVLKIIPLRHRIELRIEIWFEFFPGCLSLWHTAAAAVIRQRVSCGTRARGGTVLACSARHGSFVFPPRVFACIFCVFVYEYWRSLCRGQMQNVSRHTTALVKKQEQLGATMFEFGVAFTLLANVRALAT